MSDSVRPHRLQPTRLPQPWDSPRKNTGVGCHCLLQCMKVKIEREVAQSCLTLSDPMDCSLQAPWYMGFSRQEYWSGLPLPSPRGVCTYVLMFVETRGGCGGRQTSVFLLRERRRLWRERDVCVDGFV